MKKKMKPASNDAGSPAEQSGAGGSVSLPSRVQTTFTKPSLTQQQFKDSVDVNKIVKQYAETGVDPYAARRATMRYGEVPSQDYTEAMFHVAEVNSAFHALPAVERASYQNDPARWLAAQEAAEAQNPGSDTPEPTSEPSEPSEASDEASQPAPQGAQNRPEDADLNIT